MADNYEILDNPVYDTEIRKLKDSDPASATNTFNPLFQKIINNIHAVKLEMGTGGRWTQYLALSELELDDAAVAAAGSLDVIIEAMPDYSMISLTITEDLPWASLLPEREGTLMIIRCDGRPNSYVDFYGESDRYIRTYHEAVTKNPDWKQDSLSDFPIVAAAYDGGFYICYFNNDIFIRTSLREEPLLNGSIIHLKGFENTDVSSLTVHNGFCIILGDNNQVAMAVLEQGVHNPGYYSFVSLERLITADLSPSFTGFTKAYSDNNKCVVAGAGPTLAYAPLIAGEKVLDVSDFTLCNTSEFNDASEINQLTYQNGYWLISCSDGIYFSPDLESSFTYLPLPGSISLIQYVNGIWVAVASDWTVHYSDDITKDADQWESFRIEAGRSTETPTFITYDNGYQIIGSTGGRIYYNDALSAENWRLLDFGESEDIEDAKTPVFGFFREDDDVVVPVYKEEFYAVAPAIEYTEAAGYLWKKIAASADLTAAEGYVPLNSRDGIRIGYNAISEADVRWSANPVAIGVDSYSEAGISIGDDSYSKAASMAIGLGAQASQYYSIAMGYQSDSAYTNTIAIGTESRSIGDRSTAVGYQSSASRNATAVGWNSNATYDSIAVGKNSYASGGISVAMGSNARATGTAAVAIGMASNASGTNSAAFGTYCFANAFGSISVGYNGRATANYSMAIGRVAQANGTYATAIGGDSIAAGTNSMSLGRGARSYSSNSTAIGTGANIPASDAETIQLGNDATSILRCKVPLTTDSDIRDKTDIKPIESALDFLSRITPLQYVYNSRVSYIPAIEELDEKNKKNLMAYGMCDYDREAYQKGTKKGERKRSGVSAQEVLSVLEEVYGSADEADIVNDNFHDLAERPEGVENKLTVNYTAFIPYLIGAVKELNAKLEKLEAGENG